MQRKNYPPTTTGRAQARRASWGDQERYERHEAEERKTLKASIGKRKTTATPPRKRPAKGGALDAGLMGGSLRAISGLTKDKGRSYKA